MNGRGAIATMACPMRQNVLGVHHAACCTGHVAPCSVVLDDAEVVLRFKSMLLCKGARDA